jgi:hypothetical protein
MEVPQGNSLCGSFKQAKISFFSFLYFSYTKSENGRVQKFLHWVWNWWEGEEVGNGEGG